MVLVFHVASGTGPTKTDGLAAFAIRPLGALGVSIFFVMSGFLLYRPFVRSHLSAWTHPSVGRYLWRRALRIFPAYWLAFFFYVYVFGSPASTVHGLADLLRYLTLQHGYDSRTALGGVPVAWTLTIEVSFYLFLPLFALVVSAAAGRQFSPHARLRVQLVFIAALFIVPSALRYLLIQSDSDLPNVFPATADWFAVGMLLAVARAWFDMGNPEPRMLQVLRRTPGSGLLGAAIVYVAVVKLALPIGFSRLEVGEHMTRNLLFAIIGLCLVAPVALGADRSSPMIRFLEWPAVRWLGMVSYGIYLWHMLVLTELRPFLIDHLGMGSGFWPALITTVLGTTAVAGASWYVVERPLIALGRSHQSRSQTSPENNEPGAPVVVSER